MLTPISANVYFSLLFFLPTVFHKVTVAIVGLAALNIALPMRFHSKFSIKLTKNTTLIETLFQPIVVLSVTSAARELAALISAKLS